MAEDRQDRAIILRNRPFQERHALVTALTEHHGLVKYLAINSRHSRRFGASLGHLMVSELRWTQKNDDTAPKLISAEVMKSFPSLQSDFDKMSLVAKFVKLIEMIHPKEDSGYSFFVYFSNLLVQTDEARQIEALDTVFLLKFLYLMGISPQLESCVLCGNEINEQTQGRTRVALSPEDGGVVCAKCRTAANQREGRLLSLQEVAELRGALNCRYREIGEGKWQSLGDKWGVLASFLN